MADADLTDTRPTIVLVAGSLRSGSYTTILLRRAGQLVPRRFRVVELDAIRPLPHYDADLDGEAAPPVVRQARHELAEAAGVLVSTPEYNGQIPGGLKNWIDWVTRPQGAHVLVGKPAAAFGAAPGAKGARTAVDWLAGTLARLGCVVVVGEPPAIAEVKTKIGEDGSIDADVESQLQSLVDALVGVIDAQESGSDSASSLA